MLTFGRYIALIGSFRAKDSGMCDQSEYNKK